MGGILHDAMAHAGPDHPGSHAHLPPFTQMPWPLHPPRLVQFKMLWQSICGSHPASHWHDCPDVVALKMQLPCPEQSLKHSPVSCKICLSTLRTCVEARLL